MKIPRYLILLQIVCFGYFAFEFITKTHVSKNGYLCLIAGSILLLASTFFKDSVFNKPKP